MIILSILCFAFAAFSCVFILFPLFLDPTKDFCVTKKSSNPLKSQEEFQALIQDRNRLFLEMSFHEEALLPEPLLAEALRVCAVLESVGIPWHTHLREDLLEKSKHPQESGWGRVSFVMVIFVVLSLLTFLRASSHEDPRLPNLPQVSIPEPIVVPKTNNVLPAVNQFVFYPNLASVQVLYTGLWRIPKSQNNHILTLILPLPNGFTKLSFDNPPADALFLDQGNQQEVRLKFSSQPGIQELHARFELPAPLGSLHFGPGSLKTLPGVTLLMLPQGQSQLRFLLENALNFGKIPHTQQDQSLENNVDFPPARIHHLKPYFYAFHADGQQPEPNSTLLESQGSFQYVHVAQGFEPYPQFDMDGIPPSRVLLWAFVGCFACLLGVFLLWSMVLKKASPHRL